MYKVKKTGYVIDGTVYHYLLEKALRITYESRRWKIWRAIIAQGTCYCCLLHMTIICHFTKLDWRTLYEYNYP